MRISTILPALLLATSTTAAPVPQTFDLGRLRELFASGGSGSGFDWSSIIPNFPGSGGGGSTPTTPITPTTPAPAPPPPPGNLPACGAATGSSANDVFCNAPCAPNIVLFARGTTEPGNIGSVVGPELRRKLNTAAPGAFNFQGLTYAANVQGNIDMGRAAGQLMLTLFNQAKAKCPSQRVFFSGYSQGAMVVHNVMGRLSADQAASVGGIVTYGDPLQRQAFANIEKSKTKIFCNDGDSVCEGGFAITPAHLQYTGAPTQQGADFIVGLKA